MDEDWRNAFGILMCMEICDGGGPGICDGLPSTCSCYYYSKKLEGLIASGKFVHASVRASIRYAFWCIA